MFATTFLGHQGWLFSTEHTHLLVDPLLTSHFGHAGVVGALFPPRDIDHAAFPPIAAVLITHEHEDHFDVPSLSRLDRGIPILLSGRSSIAARTFLAELGFTVRLVHPGDTVTVGDLEIALYSPDHAETLQSDEWDVLQFTVRDRAGHGSFVTSVDCGLSPATFAAMQQDLGSRGIWCNTNNVSAWSFLEGGDSVAEEPRSSLAYGAELAQLESGYRHRWGPPAAILFCGGGWSFTGERTWLNHQVFPNDSARIAEAMRATLPDEVVRAPAPGETVVMKEGRVVAVEERTSFLAARPRAEWPSRVYRGDIELIESYEPACGRKDLQRAELDELLLRLSDYASYLYGGTIFRGLCSLDTGRLAGRQPTFALVALTGEERASYVLAYDPAGCRFVLGDVEEPMEELAAGLECWGTDLLALLRCDFGPTGTTFGRQRTWSHHVKELPHGALAFWAYCNPLRRPGEFLAMYRRLFALEPASVPRVPCAAPTSIAVRTRPVVPASP